MLADVEAAIGSYAPSGTVTVMFTDIVGSTGLKSRMPGQTTEEKDRRFLETVKIPVDEIVLAAIGVNGFVAKDTGDGFLIAFSSAEDAVLCALEIQRSLAEQPISVPGGSLELRIGLNTGHMVYRNNDYHSTAVDKAKRVQEAAQPSGVVVSNETYTLISGKLKDVRFVKWDGITLKGLGAETLYIASLTDLDAGHSPLQSLLNPERATEDIRFAVGEFSISDDDDIVTELSSPRAEPDLIAECVTASSNPDPVRSLSVDLRSRETSPPTRPVNQDLPCSLGGELTSANSSAVARIVPAVTHAGSPAREPSIRTQLAWARKVPRVQFGNAKVISGCLAALLAAAIIGINWPRIASALHIQSAEVRATLQLAPGVTMELVRIPAGDFLMGDDDQKNNPRFEPRHKVYVAEFYMLTTPVTVSQYRAFCAEMRGGRMPQEPTFNQSWAAADHPIVNVTFKDAQEFCAWVAAKTGRRVRLPTEAEWEKAARGMDGKRYPWGDEDPTRANEVQLLWCSIGSEKGRTNAVGRFPANEFGLFDMAGNVWQWCDSLYDHEHDWRVVRGGSWKNDFPTYFRASYRAYGVPTDRNGYFGFRCASGP